MVSISACEPAPTDVESTWRGFREVTALAGGETNLRSLRALDVTGDGRPDLLAALSGHAGVRVWRNLSNGSFATPVDHSMGSDVMDADAGDVNGDGIADLVAVAHFGNALLVRPGLGSGTFGPQVSYPLRNHGRIVRVADVDGDGIDDVIAVHDGSGQPVYVTVFLGTRGGSLSIVWESGSAFANARDLAVGDFNDDGLTDLVIATGDDRAALLIYYGSGDAGFGAAVVIPSRTPGMPDGVLRIDSGDVDGDGIDDIVSTHYDPSNEIAVWPGSLTGIAGSARIPVDGPADVVLGDVNGDGFADAIVSQLDAGALTILLGRGGGMFDSFPAHPVDPGSSDLVRADFNGDGWIDIANASVVANRVRVLINRTWSP